MPSPSCPSVIDQSHPQSANPHDNPLLANIPEPNSEEEEEEEEEYAARLYLAVTYGKETLDFFFKDMHVRFRIHLCELQLVILMTVE